MPKWVQLPQEKFFYQPDQQTFLEARRKRYCSTCQEEYRVIPGISANCPTCDVKGTRVFDRLTIIAGRRWGKSKIGSVAAVEEACIPNSIVWCCAPTNPKLHRYVIPAIQELIPPDWVKGWTTEFNDLRLENGSLIHFQTLEDPDQGRGQGLDALWIDEVCELTKAHWEVIRPSLAGDTVAFFTTSPRGYDWVYEELYRPACDCRGDGCINPATDANPTGHAPGYWACHTKTSQSANPRISGDFLAREKSQMSDTMYRQEYEADFVIFTGAVYGAALNDSILHDDDAISKLIPEWPDIAPWRQVVVGIDTGADHPFGAVKLVSTEKGMVVVGEYLERHRSFIEHKSALVSLAANPNAKWAINRNERQPMIELAQPPNVIACFPAENDVVAGTERVKSWLHARQLFFIERLCPNTVKQMKAYRWAENTSPKDGSTRKEKVFKKEDELPDALRYALMTWPVLPKPIEQSTKRDLSALPGEMKASIERLRRIDHPKSELKETDSTGDFWL